MAGRVVGKGNKVFNLVDIALLRARYRAMRSCFGRLMRSALDLIPDYGGSDSLAAAADTPPLCFATHGSDKRHGAD